MFSSSSSIMSLKLLRRFYDQSLNASSTYASTIHHHTTPSLTPPPTLSTIQLLNNDTHGLSSGTRRKITPLQEPQPHFYTTRHTNPNSVVYLGKHYEWTSIRFLEHVTQSRLCLDVCGGRGDGGIDFWGTFTRVTLPPPTDASCEWEGVRVIGQCKFIKRKVSVATVREWEGVLSRFNHHHHHGDAGSAVDAFLSARMDLHKLRKQLQLSTTRTPTPTATTPTATTDGTTTDGAEQHWHQLVQRRHFLHNQWTTYLSSPSSSSPILGLLLSSNTLSPPALKQFHQSQYPMAFAHLVPCLGIDSISASQPSQPQTPTQIRTPRVGGESMHMHRVMLNEAARRVPGALAQMGDLFSAWMKQTRLDP